MLIVGLGLEFTKQILSSGESVVSTCRNPTRAIELHNLKEKYGDKLLIVSMDTTVDSSIREAYEKVQSHCERSGTTLHRLINVSGLLHDKAAGMLPETSYTKIERSSLQRAFETNAWGPILVCKQFLPLLIESGQRCQESPAVIANMSARVSSIGDNALGGWYSYRSSKAALNQLTKCLSIEIARKKTNVAAILLHPGTCDTDLSKPFQRNVPPEKLFSKERGVNQLLDIINGIQIADNGKFFAWDGQTIEW